MIMKMVNNFEILEKLYFDKKKYNDQHLIYKPSCPVPAQPLLLALQIIMMDHTSTPH